MSSFDIYGLTGGPFQTNAYLVIDKATHKAALVDPGWDADEHWPPVIDEHGAKLESIILTHGHIDHVSGVAAILRAYPGLPVYIHRDDEMMLSFSKAGEMFGLPFETSEATDYFEEGKTFSVGETTFDVFHTPGHSPGHIVLLCGNHLIAGDVIFQGSIGRTDLPGGSYEILADSILTKVMTLDDDVVIYPGHGPVTSVGRERSSNPFVSQMIAEKN